MSELIYGRRAVLETLKANRRSFFRLWLEGDRPPKEGSSLADIVGLAEEHNVPTRNIKGGLFDKLMREGVRTQGVALEANDYPYATLDDCLANANAAGEPPLLLMLDHLQDPQNLGTLMRTAEAMGVHGIIIPDRRSAGITPAVSNASAGAVEHLTVVQINNLNRTIDALKKQNVWVAGLEGGEDVPPLEDVDLNGGVMVVVGSEGKGLSRLTREKCDFLLRLPMVGAIDSLNAAVAGSIVLYAARRARR
jgi:23S rRNA (guanosine2251-2'-O)-methyltransferase